MRYAEKTHGTIEPVTLDEARLHTKASSGDIEDGRLAEMIRASRRLAEQYARIAISPRDYIITLRPPRWRGNSLVQQYSVDDPDKVIPGPRLPITPIIALGDMEWVLADQTREPGFTGTLDPTLNRVMWAKAYSPSDVSASAYALEITVTAGFPVKPDNSRCEAPDDIREAVLDMVTQFFAYRGSRMGVEITPRAASLLRPYWTSVSYK